MKRFSVLLAIIIGVSSLSLLGCGLFGDETLDYTKKTEFVFSDSGLYLEVMAEKSSKFNDAFAEILQQFEEIDNQININRDGDSDVLAINLALQNQPIEIREHTYNMIVLAKQMYTQTGGAFNIAAYPLVYLWGIDALGFEDFKAGKKPNSWRTPTSFADSDIVRTLPLPDYAEVQRVKEFCDLDALEVTEADGKYFATKATPQLMIDLGGISKGYCADLAAEILSKNGVKSAMVDISGNLAFVGKYHNRLDWNVGISDTKDDIFAVVGLKSGQTAVTSGDYERFRVVGGLLSENLQITHIINTQTGLPYGIEYDGMDYKNIADRVVSCTVVMDNSVKADCLATAACVKGLAAATEFLAEQNVKAVIITADGKYALVGGLTFIQTDEFDIFKDFELVE